MNLKRRSFMTWMTGAFAATLLMAGMALAATVNLEWNYPTPEPAGLAGFRVYWGTTSQVAITAPVDTVSAAPYDSYMEVQDPIARQASITINTPGIYYFRMVAYGDIDGQPADSTFSEEVQGFITYGSPTGLRIQSILITFQ